MKKHLVLLTGFLAAGGTMAQSSVTLFGVVDANLARGTGSISNRNLLNSGSNSASRLGFRGTEDLGGGLWSGFWLEAGLANDVGAGLPGSANNQAFSFATGTNPQAFAFNRRSTVSLGGSFGEVRLGRDVVPQYWNLTFDPFTNYGAGASLTYIALSSQVTAVRASNSVGYVLPASLGGVYGQAMAYAGENTRGSATSHDGDGGGARLGYKNGPVDIAAAFGRTKYAAGDFTMRNIGGEYKFDTVRLLAQYTADTLRSVDAKGGLLGGVMVHGAGEFKLSYSRYKTDASDGPNSRKIAAGYVYFLSKRTAVYTSLAHQTNQGGASAALNGAVTAPNGKSNGIDIGIRHAF